MMWTSPKKICFWQLDIWRWCGKGWISCAWFLKKVTASFSWMQISCGFAIHSHIFSLMEIFRLHVITMSVGNAIDLRNIANGGFNYVKSNNQSIEFYKFWYYSWLRYPGYHDQGVLNFIKHDPYITDIGLTIKCLSTTYFGAICEPSGDLNEVCTMHANCCIGLQSKLNGLRIIMEDWRDYMSMPRSLKKFGTFSWRVPHNCSLSF